MPSVLVDANVLLDILTPDPRWEEWSSAALAEAAERSTLVINPIIYSEVSIGFSRIEDLDDALLPGEFLREPLPWDAGFLAGKSFVEYRQRGGERRSPLPDFYIGAHAAVRGYTLLTRDPARYRAYFPSLSLITPPRVRR
ncbi:MAG: type II toxin-antitoxin system VapC family toxin [Gemmatimonadota bacterium]|nr:type II toxin-antitoxin system VapC family toxin [Gemmatimonadota bacterium]